MAVRLGHIFRHPVKALSRERLARVRLTAGEGLPWDRHWAVTHDGATYAGGWAKKANFLRGVTGPGLMAVTSGFDETTRRLVLSHPARPPLDLQPDAPEAGPAIAAWLDPIWPAEAPRPTGIVTAGRPMTDVPQPWIAVHNLASQRQVAERLGLPDLSIHRWRGNLWLDGLDPWAEFGWIGQELRIGAAVLVVRQRITRCKATMANPETGERDADTLAALRDGWGHQDFGVYAEVVAGAGIAEGDPVAVPA